MRFKAKPLVFTSRHNSEWKANSLWGIYLIESNESDGIYSCWFTPIDGDKSFIGTYKSLKEARDETNRINEKSINLKLSKYTEYIEGLYEV